MNADTFCVRPLTHLYVGTDGQYRLCCASEDSYLSNAKTDEVDAWWNSEYLKDVRKNLLNGIRIPECNRCWRNEDAGIRSHRLRSNREYLVNANNYKKFLSQLNPNNKIIDLELHHTNLCNLKCLMCYEGASSQFGNENLKLGFDYNRQIYNWPLERVEELLASGLHVLNIIGGEPLINTELYNLIESCYNKGYLKNTLLHITTNCTRIDKWHDLLAKIPSLRIMASVDGFDDVYEYIRFGADWNVVSENILKLQKISNLMVNSVVQNLNILNIHKLIEWTELHNIALELCIIDRPNYYRINNFPQPLLDSALENVNNIKVKNKCSLETTEILINFLKSHKSNMTLWKEFWNEINLRQSIRKNNILHVIPELKDYQKGYVN